MTQKEAYEALSAYNIGFGEHFRYSPSRFCYGSDEVYIDERGVLMVYDYMYGDWIVPRYESMQTDYLINHLDFDTVYRMPVYEWHTMGYYVQGKEQYNDYLCGRIAGRSKDMYNAADDRGDKQNKAYMNGGQIKVGDKFLWHFRKDKYFGFATSGTLSDDYMATDNSREGDVVLTVIAVYEGMNGYGKFIDYWLNESGKFTGKFNQKENGAIIINGVDAFRMERYEETPKNKSKSDSEMITDLVRGYTRYLQNSPYTDSPEHAERLIKSAREYENDRFPELLDRANAWDEFVPLLPRLAMYQSSDGQDLIQVSDIVEFMREKGIIKDEKGE